MNASVTFSGTKKVLRKEAHSAVQLVEGWSGTPKLVPSFAVLATYIAIVSSYENILNKCLVIH